MDREVFNLYERAMSSHFNDAQSIGRRDLEGVLRLLGSRRKYPTLEITQDTDGDQLVPESFVLGLEVTKLSSTQVTVHPGVLANAAPANLTLGALDSATQVGTLRAAQPVTVPVDAAATLGNRYLLAARVVESVELNTLVDVWDIPTQTFIPTLKDKRVELKIEFSFWAGPSTGTPGLFGFAALDAPTAGQGWEPLAWVHIFSNTANAQHLAVIDARRDARDLLLAQCEDPDSGLPSPPEFSRRVVLSTATASNPTAQGLKGSVLATLRGRPYAFDVDYALKYSLGASNQGESLTADTLTHVWLVPAVSGTVKRVPSYGVAGADKSRFRGWLLYSQTIGPNADGTNPAGLRMPTNHWAEMDAIPAGDAVHVCSVTSVNGLNFRPFNVVGNCHRYSQLTPALGAPVALEHNFVNGLGEVKAMPLTSFVPRNARLVRLAIELIGSHATHTGLGVNIEVGLLVSATIPAAQVLVAGALTITRNGLTSVLELELPLPVPDSSDPVSTDPDAYLDGMYIQFTPTSTPGANVAFRVRVLGWDY